MEIRQSPVGNKFEDYNGKYRLILSVRGKDFVLTLAMLNYFSSIRQGAISSNINPSLTHGIAQLDTLLLEEFGESKPESIDECEIKVLINTTSGQEKKNYAFDGDYLSL